MDTYEVKNAFIKTELQEIGKTLENGLSEGWEFAILVFRYSEDGAIFYQTNARHEVMLAAMREIIRREEAEEL